MRKISMFLCAALFAATAHADEGMWLLPYLQKMNIADMQSKGCRLSAEEIYSPDHVALKDAIVIFGGGCTGEVVSPEGLLLTNHHCGYDAIQSLSSVENDFLSNGFWARSREEELPAPGLQVRFVRHIADVTAEVLGAIPSIARGEERAKLVDKKVEEVKKQLQKEYPTLQIGVQPFFGGNQYFAFAYEVYKDIRLVGTPPNSIGKFGGDTDNWMWPRHTGDFSVFRIYAGKDNRPAEFSRDNVPYKADQYLKVSLDGYKEGDFAMIMGFPGSTQRYMTSYAIDQMLRVENPQRIFIRGERQKLLLEDMAASDKVRIQYASKYARSSNYWKNSIGMSRGIERLGVKARKEAQEAAFQAWAEANTLPEEGYIEALPMLKRAIEGSEQTFADRQFLAEAFLTGVELITPANYLTAEGKPMKKLKEVEEWREFFADWYKDYSPETDRKVAKRMLTIARERMKRLPSFYTEIVDKEFGGNIEAYVDHLYDHSIFASEERVMALLDNYSPAKIAKDPALALAHSVMALYKELNAAYMEQMKEFADGHRLYIKGLMTQHPDRAWASDANFTLRLTYGQVFPYDPADGVTYHYYTTLKGVMEKEDPTNPEFIVPARLKELYAAKDYGRYANERGELPVAFLANLDITGGNSGSPIMNGRGELLGLAFDGNWEAMSGDVAFEPELQRTISVDIRYVLFVIDKYAGAGWLLDEMTLVKDGKPIGR